MKRHFLGALVGASLLLFLSTVSALGHAELEESDPADGETIETPYTLTATFTEGFDPNPQRSFVLVRDVAGDEVARGGVSEDDPTMMTVDLPALEPGEYTVRWQTTTADDQGVERGTFTFNVAAAASPSPTATPSPTPTAAPTTAGPTATPQPSTSPPTTTPSPTASPIVGGGQPTAGTNDALLAIALAAIVIGAIALFLFARSRR